jgi:hypothetical protein
VAYQPNDDVFTAAYAENDEWLRDIVYTEAERPGELQRLKAGAHLLLQTIAGYEMRHAAGGRKGDGADESRSKARR